MPLPPEPPGDLLALLMEDLQLDTQLTAQTLGRERIVTLARREGENLFGHLAMPLCEITRIWLQRGTDIPVDHVDHGTVWLFLEQPLGRLQGGEAIPLDWY